MKHTFILKSTTPVICGENDAVLKSEPVRRAVERFYRDRDMTLAARGDSICAGGENVSCAVEGWQNVSPDKCSSINAEGCICLRMSALGAEMFRIESTEQQLTVLAGDALGFVYALLFLSEKFLGIQPFWFWNDQQIRKRKNVNIEAGTYESPRYRVRYRGWFINDEVLISHWDAGVDAAYPWEMVFEALLRAGGNLVIPGTDKNSRKYAHLASGMGLVVTHHHAEALGAEMFARVYPDKTPSFTEHPDLFRGLWRDAIARQNGQQVIWNIGFRGQGDRPFWADDADYDTPKKRGALIGSIMREQYEMVREKIPDAVFCTNLYGEIMELYRDGFLEVPEDVIMIWADNGYGKMVSRRQGNHNPRVPALPGQHLRTRAHGTYYHVSFYDLQAANHITMLPNPMEFVERELESAYDSGIRDLWIVNASNIKPHVYPLDFIGNLWREDPVGAKEHRERYLRAYYFGGAGTDKRAPAQAVLRAADCMAEYAACTVAFGSHEDEHAGEQFYNYLTRYFAHGWMKDGGSSPCAALYWCAKEETFAGQIAWYRKKCKEGELKFGQLLHKCEEAGRELQEEAGEDAAFFWQLWNDSIVLQVKLHLHCLRGALFFCDAYERCQKGGLMDAFYLLGKAADAYGEADRAMRQCGHDKWKGFYENDCLTDVKQTAYNLRGLMRYVRNLGDGPDFYEWQREVIYGEEDRRVVLITNMENHMTDEALYAQMCRMGWESCGPSGN